MIVGEEREERIPGEKNGAPGEGKVRDVSRKAAWGIALLLALLWAGTMAFYNVPAFHQWLHPHPAEGTVGTAEESGKYTCPMHPFIVTDRPGACPICGMTLVLQSSAAAAAPDNAAPAKKERKIMYWTDPMIPGDRSDKPGKSPMGMERTPVYEEEAIGMVAMNPTQRLMANVATQKVASREFVLDTFSVGKVSWDERRVAKVTARFGGRVEKLHVDFTGTGVTGGQPLLEIFSPEVIATQREYLLAIEGMERMKGSPYEDARSMSAGILDASRRRLALWGVTGEQIEGLERTKEPKTVFTVSAPSSGIVTERLVSAGKYVMEGNPLYSIFGVNSVFV